MNLIMNVLIIDNNRNKLFSIFLGEPRFPSCCAETPPFICYYFESFETNFTPRISHFETTSGLPPPFQKVDSYDSSDNSDPISSSKSSSSLNSGSDVSSLSSNSSDSDEESEFTASSFSLESTTKPSFK